MPSEDETTYTINHPVTYRSALWKMNMEDIHSLTVTVILQACIALVESLSPCNQWLCLDVLSNALVSHPEAAFFVRFL